MLASRLPGILPALDDAAALEVAAIRSLSGRAGRLARAPPPLEAPHHSASIAALVGGGSRVAASGRDRPRHARRAVPRRGGRVRAERARRAAPAARDGRRSRSTAPASTASFPASFQLILATNPCPCGNYGVRGGSCVCAPMAIRRYLGRLSGPLLDRVDIELGLARVSVAHASDARGRRRDHRGGSRRASRRRATRAAHRLRDTPWRLNARVSGPWLREGPLAPPARRAPADRRRAAPRLADTARL